MVFSRFSLACFSIYLIIAESETQMSLSCKITPDASAVSESSEESEIRRPTLQQILKNTAEPIYMKTGSNVAYILGFDRGVKDLSVVYREASSIATSKASECT